MNKRKPIGFTFDTYGAAEYLDMSPDWVRQQRSKGTGPPYLKIGGSVKYLEADLRRWLEENKVYPEYGDTKDPTDKP